MGTIRAWSQDTDLEGEGVGGIMARAPGKCQAQLPQRHQGRLRPGQQVQGDLLLTEAICQAPTGPDLLGYSDVCVRPSAKARSGWDSKFEKPQGPEAGGSWCLFTSPFSLPSHQRLGPPVSSCRSVGAAPWRGHSPPVNSPGEQRPSESCGPSQGQPSPAPTVFSSLFESI